jgi:ankyrin repeat protein
VNAQARGNAVKGGAAIDVAGKTALALASMGGQTAIVDVLLAAGAQVTKHIVAESVLLI